MRVAPDMQILQTMTIHQYPEVGREPDVCFGDSSYLVVWSQGEFGGESYVRAARVSTEGTVLDTGIVCGMDHYCEYHPSVAFDGDRYLVVWYNYVELPAGIFGRFVGQDCVPVGHEFQIRDLPVNTCNDPDIAFLDSVYLVVWNEPSPYYDDDVYGQIIDMNGSMIGNTIPIAVDSFYQYQVSVCAADTIFIVVWYQNSHIYGQFISLDGSLLGGNFQISDPPVHPRDLPDIACGGPQPLTVWHEFVDDDHGIYGNLDVSPWVLETRIATQHNNIYIPTIIAGAFYVPSGCVFQVYDIMGREVYADDPAPGIYFIKINGRIVNKIVKIK